jgi:hypothetical protein
MCPGVTMASVAQSEMRRGSPRVPFAAVVELETPEFVAYGHSDNISLGGMLVRCESAFLPGSSVLLTFVPPGSQRLQIQSRVVHCRPGVRVGLQFVELRQEDQTLLSKLAQPPAIAAPRRSPRIPRRFIVELRWLQKGHMVQASAETVLVSSHGCLVLTDAELETGSSVALLWPEVAKAAQARVVWRQLRTGDTPRVALEFVPVNDFWKPDSMATA